MDYVLKPLEDRIVVEPIPLEPVSKTITLVELGDKGPARRGVVKAVGPGKWVESCAKKGVYVRRKPEVREGQIVQFGPYSIDGEWDGLCVIREMDILVIEN